MIRSLKGGEDMGYNVKDDHPGIGGVLKGLLARFIKLVVFAVLGCGLLYGLFAFLYHQFPEVQHAMDQLIALFRPIYDQYGIWAVLGVIVFVIAAVWALGDELRRKERRREMTREMMK